ncbi:uncharacterized protein NEMAJ01_1741 [Nematocida major]|uniref:uncharacterized protein n=1 Tax=Nematocida major TaxID=1912982 RepID=UPI002007502A|nr:uncharacterized protein NEMAJ01_1741 [Nematocida major]KAH9386845.1 hypothetical protein NEMAJ01_1741 [Nematocida major]
MHAFFSFPWLQLDLALHLRPFSKQMEALCSDARKIQVCSSRKDLARFPAFNDAGPKHSARGISTHILSLYGLFADVLFSREILLALSRSRAFLCATPAGCIDALLQKVGTDGLAGMLVQMHGGSFFLEIESAFDWLGADSTGERSMCWAFVGLGQFLFCRPPGRLREGIGRGDSPQNGCLSRPLTRSVRMHGLAHTRHVCMLFLRKSASLGVFIFFFLVAHGESS